MVTYLVHGLYDYATQKLPSSLNEEYILEFQGIDRLLRKLSSRRSHIHRFLSRDRLIKEIELFLDQERETQTKLEEWQKMGPESILQTLFLTGVIGALEDMPNDHNESWPKGGKYVWQDRELQINNYKHLMIRPAYWYYLTNIETEIKQRRRYIEALFSQLEVSLRNLSREIRHVRDNDADLNDEFFYCLGQFLVLSKTIHDYTGYPGPEEHQKWSLAKRAIEKSWRIIEYKNSTRDNKDPFSYYEATKFAIEFEKILVLTPPTFKLPKFTWIDLTDFIDEEKNPGYRQVVNELNRESSGEGYSGWLDDLLDSLVTSATSVRSTITVSYKKMDQLEDDFNRENTEEALDV